MNEDLARPTVTCSVLERQVADARQRIDRIPKACGLVEIRGDHLRGEEISSLIRQAGRPVIVTLRSPEHGGAFEGSEDERREILSMALRAGARFIDVEHRSGAAVLAEGPHASRVILSHHGAPCRLEALVPLLREMTASRAGRLKIVPCATVLEQAGAVRDLLRLAAAQRTPLACFASGGKGAVTRLLACSWGSWTTYGAPRHGAESAEGQFTVEDLLDTYGVLDIGKETRLYALVGASVRRSPSPAMHRAGYREAGIDARYLPLETERFDEVGPLAGPDGILGLDAMAVTMPFKEEAARNSEPADETSARCGSVNTIIVSPHGWLGYNTDGPAALERICRHIEPQGRAAAVIGAGGTGRAIAFALHQAGAAVTLFNRSKNRASRAARDLGLPAASLEELGSAPWEILVNATPLGSHGEEVVPADRLRGRLVLDAVYGRQPTLLAREARKRGLAVVEGFELLCAQAARQFEHMTGRPVREATLSAAGTQWLSIAGP